MYDLLPYLQPGTFLSDFIASNVWSTQSIDTTGLNVETHYTNGSIPGHRAKNLVIPFLNGARSTQFARWSNKILFTDYTSYPSAFCGMHTRWYRGWVVGAMIQTIAITENSEDYIIKSTYEFSSLRYNFYYSRGIALFCRAGAWNLYGTPQYAHAYVYPERGAIIPKRALRPRSLDHTAILQDRSFTPLPSIPELKAHMRDLLAYPYSSRSPDSTPPATSANSIGPSASHVVQPYVLRTYIGNVRTDYPISIL